MRNDRNCGMPYPVYQNPQPMMPMPMPTPMPTPMPMPMPTPMPMPVPTFPSSNMTTVSQPNYSEQICRLQQEVNSLDRRCSALERAVGTNTNTNNINPNTNYGDSNFQMI